MPCQTMTCGSGCLDGGWPCREVHPEDFNRCGSVVHLTVARKLMRTQSLCKRSPPNLRVNAVSGQSDIPTNVVRFAASPLGRIVLWMENLPENMNASSRLAFWAIASYAHPDGKGVFAGIESLTKRSGLPRRTFLRGLADLISKDIILEDGWHQNQGGARTRQRCINLKKLLAADHTNRPVPTECHFNLKAVPTQLKGGAVDVTQTADRTEDIAGRENSRKIVTKCQIPTKESPATTSRDLFSFTGEILGSRPLSEWTPDQIMQGWCKKHDVSMDLVVITMQENIRDAIFSLGRAIPEREINRAFYSTAKSILNNHEGPASHINNMVGNYEDEIPC